VYSIKKLKKSDHGPKGCTAIDKKLWLVFKNRVLRRIFEPRKD
jgi:hypothetical protein